MALTREGAEYKNDLLWNKQGTTYHVGLSHGQWSPTTTLAPTVFQTEVSETRVEPTITITWNDTLERDEVTIEAEFTPTASIVFNRIFVMVDGRATPKYSVTFTGFNGFTIDDPASNPFAPGDRVIYNAKEYTVDSVDSLDVVVTPSFGAGDLPSSGSGTIIDGTGVLLVASITPEVYNLTAGETSNIKLTGNSFS